MTKNKESKKVYCVISWCPEGIYSGGDVFVDNWDDANKLLKFYEENIDGYTNGFDIEVYDVCTNIEDAVKEVRKTPGGKLDDN